MFAAKGNRRHAAGILPPWLPSRRAPQAPGAGSLFRGDEAPGSLVDGGFPRVMSQTIRAMLYSRMRVGFGKYDKSYDHSDLVLFQPDSDDALMFFTNVFSFSSRRHLCEHAYATTLADLRRNRESLGKVLARHGLHLRDEILDDEQRTVWDGLIGTKPPNSTLLSRLDRALNELDRVLERSRRAKPASRKRSSPALALDDVGNGASAD